MTQTCRLTIVEGCDGGGKTTFAHAFARETHAHYVHFGPLPHVHDHLARMYVEAMQPALLGLQDVVFDRSWLSERPYGMAFRHGQDRLSPVIIRMLERLAFRCGAVVVHCRPTWATTRKNFIRRRAEEYMDTVTQLQHVYQLYETTKTALPMIQYNFQRDQPPTPIIIDASRMPLHARDVRSAGNRSALCAIVGESCAEWTDRDAWYQWPCASFSKTGSAYRLTRAMMTRAIDEASLYWVNCDQPNFATTLPHAATIFALGTRAGHALHTAGMTYHQFDDPQTRLRGVSEVQSPLIRLLSATLKETYATR